MRHLPTGVCWKRCPGNRHYKSIDALIENSNRNYNQKSIVVKDHPHAVSGMTLELSEASKLWGN